MGGDSSLSPCSEQLHVSMFCFLVPQWIHILRQSLGAFGLFPNHSLGAGGPHKSRSLFGVLVSPQEYRKLGFGFVSVFFYLRYMDSGYSSHDSLLRLGNNFPHLLREGIPVVSRWPTVVPICLFSHVQVEPRMCPRGVVHATKSMRLSTPWT